MTQDDAKALADKLRARFGGEVDIEEVSPGRFRYMMVSPAFAGVPHLRRQDEVWAAVDEAVSREHTLDVSLILTLDPSDVQREPV